MVMICVWICPFYIFPVHIGLDYSLVYIKVLSCQLSRLSIPRVEVVGHLPCEINSY